MDEEQEKRIIKKAIILMTKFNVEMRSVILSSITKEFVDNWVEKQFEAENELA